ncbi:hypothetical protein WICMUC_005332 [Wickerhamomyces mucosus]|uniref:Carbonic anhydrase n=1 Tax=Wickerhamomyces mucosus TaxID=1378264 RepID=A0A9P8P979_9ASCO|nr:hypothetical protein WICMUC_005332 [Wickerhamomyces mucosus]
MSSSSSSTPFTLTTESTLKDYLQSNKQYVDKINHQHPSLFELNGQGQAPHTLWVGCSDSRYNENCLNVVPGEVFTFKNICNLIDTKDQVTRATLEFSINVLKVKKIIICGHTSCGGVLTSLSHKQLGETNSNLQEYLYKIDQLRDENTNELNKFESIDDKAKKLAELNVLKQLQLLKNEQTVIDAVNKGELEIWGLLYNVDSGLLEVVKA